MHDSLRTTTKKGMTERAGQNRESPRHVSLTIDILILTFYSDQLVIDVVTGIVNK